MTNTDRDIQAGALVTYSTTHSNLLTPLQNLVWNLRSGTGAPERARSLLQSLLLHTRSRPPSLAEPTLAPICSEA